VEVGQPMRDEYSEFIKQPIVKQNLGIMKRRAYLLFFSITFTIFVVSSAEGQSIERVSRPKATSKLVGRLDGAIWWRNLSDQWSIDSKVPSYLELREIVVNGVSYMVLVQPVPAYTYQYPELQIGRIDFMMSHYYVFDKKRLLELITDKTEMNKAYSIDMELVATEKWRETQDADEIGERIYSAITRQKTELDNYRVIGLLWGVFPVIHEGKKKVRYLFFPDLSETIKPKFEPLDFDKNYFEVDFDSFYKFVRIDETSAKTATVPTGPLPKPEPLPLKKP
jgi:hypothetical protein